MAQELHAVIGAHLQDTSEGMVRAAQDRCPTLLSDPRTLDAVRQACAPVQVPASAVHNAVVNEAGAAVLSAVGEAQLALAAAVSGQVIDSVVGALASTCRAMSGESGVTGTSSGGGGTRKRASTGSEVGGRGSSDSSRSDVLTPSHDDSNSVRSGDPSPMKLEYLNLATPQLASKRKSLHGRKLRPQSVVGAAESLGSVGELPSRVGQQLKHLVKQRPRRHKTRQPTKAVGALAAALPEEDDITHGVETFFRGDASTPSTPLLLSPESEHSGRLGKYEWNSSMDSFPPGGGGGGGSSSVAAPSAGAGGSADSLSRSESVLESECTTARDSPSTGGFTQHDTDDEDNAVFDECNEVPRRRAGTGSSSMGGALARGSPDRTHRNTFTALLNDDEGAELLTQEEEELRKVAGLAKMGLGYGVNVMAEMRARHKRSSVLAREDDCDGVVGSLSQHLLSSAKLRHPASASPASNGFSKQPRSLHSPGEGSEDEDCSVRSRASVRQLAASLSIKQEDATGNTRLSAAGGSGRASKGGHRSPNLPPFPVPPGVMVSPELLSALDKRRSTLHQDQGWTGEVNNSVPGASVSSSIVGVLDPPSDPPSEGIQPPDYPPPPPPPLSGGSSSSGGAGDSHSIEEDVVNV